jgi:integrative and conjugative element protein (TIGR02256 family)
MGSPIFLKTDGGKLEIGAVALARMLTFRQDGFWKREAGGVLMGRFIHNSLDIVIDDVTVPMRGDVRGRFKFLRDRYRHQQILNQVWQDSGRTTHYLGEWHTHPEPIPTPSATDLRDWGRRLQEDVFSSSTLLFIIVGIEVLRIWEGHRHNLSFILIGEMSYVSDSHLSGKRKRLAR